MLSALKGNLKDNYFTLQKVYMRYMQLKPSSVDEIKVSSNFLLRLTPAENDLLSSFTVVFVSLAFIGESFHFPRSCSIDLHCI